MRITWNAPIVMPDGITLRADVFRPVDESARYPVIISHGLYAKGLSYQEGYSPQWEKMVQEHPEILDGSTNKYQCWEVTDPERWVPHGYAVVRVDSRGVGCSEGFLDPTLPSQEADDHVTSIEWAGTQAWSNGAVGILGISYYAVMGWLVAARQPRHLKALIPWEGFVDSYRDLTYHGGILSEFQKRWSAIQAVTVQHGLGRRARKNPNTGESIAGHIELSDDELARNRKDGYREAMEHPFDDDYWKERRADLSKVTVPFLSCANWGGMGIHPRGNFLAFTEAAAEQKWLEVHGDTHWSLFSSNYGLDLQKRFFDHFLKGVDNGWDSMPPVKLNVRHSDGRFVTRDEQEWPLARAQWTRYYLDASTLKLGASVPEKPASATYEGFGEGVIFRTEPLVNDTEITGPLVAKLFLESSTKDADLFLTVQAFDPTGRELTFQGALDPNTPIAMGWLRASRRRIDPQRSKPWQPFHSHEVDEPLTPGVKVEVDIEILPTCLVLPAGWTIALSIRGKDYEFKGDIGEFGSKFHYATRGTGGMTHQEDCTRPESVFNNTVTVYSGGNHASYLLMPLIPSRN